MAVNTAATIQTALRKDHATIPQWLLMRDDWNDLRSGPLRTWAILEMMTDEDNKVTIKIETMSQVMNTVTRTLSRHLDHLRAIGAITAHPAPVPTQAHTWELHIDGPAPRPTDA